jgi:hypothetical protein
MNYGSSLGYAFRTDIQLSIVISRVAGRAASWLASVDLPAAIFPQNRYKVARPSRDRLPARRGRDLAIPEYGALAVAHPVDRRQHPGRKPAGFADDGIDEIVAEIIDPGRARKMGA